MCIRSISERCFISKTFSLILSRIIFYIHVLIHITNKFAEWIYQTLSEVPGMQQRTSRNSCPQAAHTLGDIPHDPQTLKYLLAGSYRSVCGPPLPHPQIRERETQEGFQSRQSSENRHYLKITRQRNRGLGYEPWTTVWEKKWCPMQIKSKGFDARGTSNRNPSQPITSYPSLGLVTRA